MTLPVNHTKPSVLLCLREELNQFRQIIAINKAMLLSTGVSTVTEATPLPSTNMTQSESAALNKGPIKLSITMEFTQFQAQQIMLLLDGGCIMDIKCIVGNPIQDVREKVLQSTLTLSPNQTMHP